FSLSQVSDLLNDDEEVSSRVDVIFITPPELNAGTDEDSGVDRKILEMIVKGELFLI
ncbi:hypothetical protein HHI36_001211, partial [Cryptolaemus montrouzieri]